MHASGKFFVQNNARYLSLHVVVGTSNGYLLPSLRKRNDIGELICNSF